MRYATLLFLVAFWWLQTGQVKADNSVTESSVKSTVVGTISGQGSYTLDQGYIFRSITFKCFRPAEGKVKASRQPWIQARRLGMPL